jgi:hypothetical protein
MASNRHGSADFLLTLNLSMFSFWFAVESCLRSTSPNAQMPALPASEPAID